MLDVLAAVLPEETIVESACWSDDEEGEDGLFEAGCKLPMTFLSSDDEDDASDDEQQLLKLQEEYNQLCKMNDRSKRTYGSPTKHPVPPAVPKPRRTFRHLPANEAGEIEFPFVLGRASNRISVSRIGDIMTVNGQDGGDGGGVVVPREYECRRRYLDFGMTADGEEKRYLHYTCSISSATPDGPLAYTISATPETITGTAVPLVCTSGRMEETWAEFRSRFPASLQASHLDEDFPGGGRAFFGLEHESLVKYMRECQ